MTTLPNLEPAALEALARAFDKEDASQRGEPDPWKDAEDDAEWVSERLACARVAAEAYLSASRSTAPEAGKAVDETLTALSGFLVFLRDMRFTGSWDLPTLNRAIEVGETIAEQESALASVPAPSGAEPVASMPTGAKWCQPGDQQTKQHFLVRFDDPDCREAVFTEWDKARAFYAKATLSWNCWLFATVPAEAIAYSTAPQAVPAEDIAGLTAEGYVSAFIDHSEETLVPLPAWERPYQDASLIEEARNKGYIWIDGDVACTVTVTSLGRTIAKLYKAAALTASEAEATSLRKQLEEHRRALDNPTDKQIRWATTEYLSHRGERPNRLLRGGQELWETHAQSMREAFRVLARTLSGASDGESN